MYWGNDTLRGYMREISQIPLVTQDEERELANHIKAGNAVAKSRLIGANLRLVVKIAHDFRSRGLPLQDLVSEGNIGLIRASEKFDPNKGAKFSSYASWWIKQAMRRAISEKSKTIRIPVASAGKMMKLRGIRRKLGSELDREPTDAEVASLTTLSEKVVRRLRLADTHTLSLQDPIFCDDDGEIGDLIADERSHSPYHIMDNNESGKRIEDMLGCLNNRERSILCMRYGLAGTPTHTLEEISSKVRRTKERVRQIQKRALKKLKLEMIRSGYFS